MCGQSVVRRVSEKIIELGGDRLSDLEFQDKVFGVYPVGVEFLEGLEQRDDMRKEKQN